MSKVTEKAKAGVTGIVGGIGKAFVPDTNHDEEAQHTEPIYFDRSKASSSHSTHEPSTVVMTSHSILCPSGAPQCHSSRPRHVPAWTIGTSLRLRRLAANTSTRRKEGRYIGAARQQRAGALALHQACAVSHFARSLLATLLLQTASTRTGRGPTRCSKEASWRVP